MHHRRHRCWRACLHLGIDGRQGHPCLQRWIRWAATAALWIFSFPLHAPAAAYTHPSWRCARDVNGCHPIRLHFPSAISALIVGRSVGRAGTVLRLISLRLVSTWPRCCCCCCLLFCRVVCAPCLSPVLAGAAAAAAAPAPAPSSPCCSLSSPALPLLSWPFRARR